MAEDQASPTPQPASPPPPPTDDQIIQSLVGTVSKSDNVVELINKMVGDNSYSRSDNRNGETRQR